MKKYELRVLMLVIIGVFFLSSNLFSQRSIIYVDMNPDITNTDRWPSPYTHLQDALAVAQPGDEIWVAEGTYYPDLGVGITSGDVNASFNITTGISIYGGFQGDESDFSFRDPVNNITILSGDIGIDKSRIILSVQIYDGTNNIIDGIEITDAMVGASLTNNNGSSTISNCQFTNIQGYSALDISSGNYLIESCIFTNNDAAFNFSVEGGGAISIYDGSSTINNCTFINNSSNTNGGAIFFFGEEKKGAYNDNSSSDLTQKTLNQAHIISNSTFIGNNAIEQGGAIYINYRQNRLPIFIESCIFKLNEASQGGAICARTSTYPTTILNCLIYDNTATTGGGIYFDKWNGNDNLLYLSLLNNTIYDNTAINGESVAAYSLMGNVLPGNVDIINSILWDPNSSNNNQIWTHNNTELNVTFSNIKGTATYPGTGNINTPPKFAEPTEGIFNLRTDSDCINAGTNSAPNLPEFDFEGDDRIINDTVDIGYDEARGIIYVDEYATGGSTGIDWTNAYLDLQSALDAAVEGNQIWVAEGIYKPSVVPSKSEKEYLKSIKLYKSQDIHSEYDKLDIPSFEDYKSDSLFYTFYINKNIELYGGFDATETYLGDRDWKINPTILSGDLGIEDDITDNCCKVVFVEDVDNGLISGFTITESAREAFNYGAFHVWDSDFNMDNCILENNHNRALSIMYHGNVQINQCLIQNNLCVENSGHITNSIVKFNYTDFINNEARLGGALWTYGSDVKIQHAIFADNHAIICGGAICMQNLVFYDPNSLNINFSTFSNNTAGSKGNSMYIADRDNAPQTLEISNSIMWNTSPVAHIETFVNGGANEIEIDVTFSDIQMASGEYGDIEGENINENPEFIDLIDFHLYTTGSSKNIPVFQSNECSPCIDTGDPDILQVNESDLSRVNMGAYGNTIEASISCSKWDSEKSNLSKEINDDLEIEMKISPNPFKYNLSINIYLQEKTYTEVIVFDIHGKKVKTLEKSNLIQGNNTIAWNGENDESNILPNGVYLVRVMCGTKTESHKVIINR